MQELSGDDGSDTSRVCQTNAVVLDRRIMRCAAGWPPQPARLARPRRPSKTTWPPSRLTPRRKPARRQTPSGRVRCGVAQRHVQAVTHHQGGAVRLGFVPPARPADGSLPLHKQRRLHSSKLQFRAVWKRHSNGRSSDHTGHRPLMSPPPLRLTR